MTASGCSTGLDTGHVHRAYTPPPPPNSSRSPRLSTLPDGVANDIGIASAVVTAKSLSVDRLISRLLDDPELERFTTQTLGPLMRYDLAHAWQLVRTLDTYMRNAMSKTRTAQDLFVRRRLCTAGWRGSRRSSAHSTTTSSV